MMGLFPEIHRAWLTIDSDIYIWTYEEGTDIAYYDGLNDTILSIGLVQPKPGVFHDFIKYLLVLCTSAEIIVLGVTFAAGADGLVDEIQLIANPVFSLPTDGSVISTVKGTESGRVFLGSKDGCLYEIVYQVRFLFYDKCSLFLLKIILLGCDWLVWKTMQKSEPFHELPFFSRSIFFECCFE